jgi:hypothetical protein
MGGKLIINVVTCYRLLIPKGTRQLADLNYGVGVRLEPGYCSIKWKQAPDDPFSFTVSGDTGAVKPGEYGAELFASYDRYSLDPPRRTCIALFKSTLSTYGPIIITP